MLLLLVSSFSFSLLLVILNMKVKFFLSIFSLIYFSKAFAFDHLKHFKILWNDEFEKKYKKSYELIDLHKISSLRTKNKDHYKYFVANVPISENKLKAIFKVISDNIVIERISITTDPISTRFRYKFESKERVEALHQITAFVNDFKKLKEANPNSDLQYIKLGSISKSRIEGIFYIKILCAKEINLSCLNFIIEKYQIGRTKTLCFARDFDLISSLVSCGLTVTEEDIASFKSRGIIP